MRFGRPLIFSSLFTLGCVGPTTPFGAIDSVTPKKVIIHEPTPAPEFVNEEQPTVEFSPRRQLLHDRSEFKVIIHDPQRFDSKYAIWIYYNGYDLTKKFLSQSKYKFDQSANNLELTFPNLRLNSFREDRVDVVFQRNPDTPPIYARYLPPTCSMEDSNGIYSMGTFSVNVTLISMLQRLSVSNDMNPSFFAGLVAQESGFDSHAVSWAKAIGLTQITNLAEQEITEIHKGWPRHTLLKRAPAAMVKALISSGRITQKNEWRLNPERSLQGGLTYLRILKDYWEKPDGQELLQQLGFVTMSPYSKEELLTKVILASYNSGASRVSQAIKNNGPKWLEDSELKEARNYVNRIFSYCYHFSNTTAEVDYENAP